jgi:hypothetical protein
MAPNASLEVGRGNHVRTRTVGNARPLVLAVLLAIAAGCIHVDVRVPSDAALPAPSAAPLRLQITHDLPDRWALVRPADLREVSLVWRIGCPTRDRPARSRRRRSRA